MATVSPRLGCVVVMMWMAVVGVPMAQGAMTCGTVVQSLMPCVPYLQSGGTPSQGCCAGVKNILGAATTTPDRQAVCNCLKDAAAAMGGINDHLALSLPSQCKVNIPYKISTSTNCATIKF